MTLQHAHGDGGRNPSRRQFLCACGAATGAVLAQPLLTQLVEAVENETGPARMAGPGGHYAPRLKAAFARREEHPSWPGALYDSEAAQEQYTQKLREAADALGMEVDLRTEVIHSNEEADGWVAEAAEQEPDGLLVFVLDRQPPAWPTVHKAIDTGLPTVAYAPMGTTFIGQAGDAAARGAFVCSATDFSDVVYGMKMLRARAMLREMRLLVVSGSERREDEIPFYGTKLRYLPESTWLETYEQVEIGNAIQNLAREYLEAATKMAGPAEQDVLNAVRAYVTARRVIEREEADALTMNCLGAAGREATYPCLAFTRLLDSGVPAICEADLNSAIALMLVPQLFDRPGFMFNIVPVTDRGAVICSHCTCATRLKGFDQPRVPFHFAPHHEDRDAVPVPHWEPGEEVTILQTPRGGGHMTILTGEVVDQVDVPPAGGCVVAPMVKLDGDFDNIFDGYEAGVITRDAGHHTLFYGNWRRELHAFCRLFGIEALTWPD
ncbi:MAG: hypothetical protein R6W89_06675 [Candidatus Hydrogenedentota bacterium]